MYEYDNIARYVYRYSEQLRFWKYTFSLNVTIRLHVYDNNCYDVNCIYDYIDAIYTLMYLDIVQIEKIIISLDEKLASTRRSGCANETPILCSIYENCIILLFINNNIISNIKITGCERVRHRRKTVIKITNINIMTAKSEITNIFKK